MGEKGKDRSLKRDATMFVAWFRRILREPVHQLDERGREVRLVVEAMRRAWRSLREDEVPRMAAALTYRTIFSLIPILVMSFVVVGVFKDKDEVIQGQLTRLLSYLNLEQISVGHGDPLAEADYPIPPNPSDPRFDDGKSITLKGFTFALDIGDDNERDTADDLVVGGNGDVLMVSKPGRDGQFETSDDEYTRMVDPIGRGSGAISDVIKKLVDRVTGYNFNAIGTAGLLFLIYAAIALMVEVERCFNQLYDAPRGRSWLMRVPQYWLVLTIGPALILASFYVGEQFRDWVARLATVGGDDGATAGGWIVRVVGHMVTISISWLLLLVVYGLVPHTRVHLRPALIGSFFAAVTWELGKWGFREYLQGYAGVNLYGSLALIPLFLMWVYITWGVVLFGLKVSFLLQNFGSWRTDALYELRSQRIVSPAAAMVVAGHVAKAFGAGGVTSASALAQKMNLEPAVLKRILDLLAERGFVRKAGVVGEEEEHEDGWTLARPAEQIRLPDLIAAGQSLARRERPLNGAVGRDQTELEVLDRLEQAELASVADVTLASLLKSAEGEDR